MALAETAKLAVQLDLKGNLGAGLDKAARGLKGLDQATSRTQASLSKTAANLGRLGAIAGTAVVGGLAAAVKWAGDFEAQLNTINTIANVNAKDLTAIGAGLRKTFAETGVPLEDLTSAYYDLLSAGVSVKDAQGELNTAVKLGIGGLGTTTEAINLLATAQNSYGLSLEGVNHAADVFAKTVELGVIKIPALAGAFADVAPVAKIAGVSIEELGASLAFITAKGAQASEAGTQVNRAIVELLKPSAELTKVQKSLGVSFEELINQKGLVGTLETIRIKAEQLGIPFQDLFGRLEGYKFALATTGENFTAFGATMTKFGNVNGTVQRQFEARAKGFTFQLGRLQAGFKNAGITIGNALLPKLTPLLTQLTDFLAANEGKIARFGDDLAAAFTKAAKFVQAVDWREIGTGLKIAGQFARGLFEAFQNLPPGTQATIIALAGLNKLTGGLVVSVTADLAKGLGGGLVKLVTNAFGSSLAGAGIGKLFVQPVFVTNLPLGGLGGAGGAAAGAAGGKGGLLRTLGTGLAVAGAAVAVGAAIDEYNKQKAGIKTLTTDTGESVKEQIKTGASTADLVKSQQALIDGIARLRSIPDFGVLTGAPIADLTAQLKVNTDELKRRGAGGAVPTFTAAGVPTGGLSPDARSELKSQNREAASVARSALRSGERSATAQEYSLAQLRTGDANQGMRTGTIVAAINHLGAVLGALQPSVTVNVTANSVTRAQVAVRRAGNRNRLHAE